MIRLGAAAVVVVALVIVAGAVLSTQGGTSDSTKQGDRLGVTLVAYQGNDLLGGQRVDLGTVVGQGKPVILNFFAGLCPPCRLEMPGFERAWERHRDEIVLLGADIGPFLSLGSHDDAKRLLTDLGITYPAAYVEENVVGRFNVVGMPTTIFYAGDGREVGRSTGVLTEEQLENAISQLLAAPVASP
ncbi:MAG: TlpA disulfide reductase family protein [Chloroflexota bacterium]